MQHIVSYSIAQGKLANIVLLRSVEVDDDSVWDGPWMTEATPEEVKACYADWEPEVQELIKVRYNRSPQNSGADVCDSL